ncbi:MAG: STAS domain-containing protein [Zoogloeaceae bacterium]|jgi:phospholipid transport system transporter-binding protein|nr:STAS domain-containing protein [Zoogloeaceae bacterium]
MPAQEPLKVQLPMTLANAVQLLQMGRDLGAGEREVDLSGVEQADSSGLAVLLEWQRLAHAAGGVLRFTHPPQSLRALTTLYDLDEVVRWEAA